jgi:hypothetical protein
MIAPWHPSFLKNALGDDIERLRIGAATLTYGPRVRRKP